MTAIDNFIKIMEQEGDDEDTISVAFLNAFKEIKVFCERIDYLEGQFKAIKFLLEAEPPEQEGLKRKTPIEPDKK